jgi:hypothetical protein
MLVAVEADAKAAVDQILQDSRIHVIRLEGYTLSVVVPDGDPKALGVFRLAKKAPGRPNASGVYRPLLAENIIGETARECDDGEIEFWVIEDGELFRGVQVKLPCAPVKLVVEGRERSHAFRILRRVSDLIQAKVLP